MEIERKIIQRARGMIISEAIGKKEASEKLQSRIRKLTREKDEVFRELDRMHSKTGKYVGMETA